MVFGSYVYVYLFNLVYRPSAMMAMYTKTEPETKTQINI
jgi:hypothetical protein